LDIFLKNIICAFVAKGKNPSGLEKVFYIEFCFLFHFSLGGENYVVPYNTVVIGILDMHQGKHILHFLVGVELLPHAFVNIPDEKIHIGVFLLFFHSIVRDIPIFPFNCQRYSYFSIQLSEIFLFFLFSPVIEQLKIG
jgi:hypothetical protein